jgi:hypothetical protein
MSPELPESLPTDNHKVMQSGTEDVPNLFDSVKQTLKAISSEYSEYPTDEVRFGPPLSVKGFPLLIHPQNAASVCRIIALTLKPMDFMYDLDPEEKTGFKKHLSRYYIVPQS